MKNKTHRSDSTSPVRSMGSHLASHFVRRLTNAAAVRSRFPLPPLGSLWDPYLLDRLHAPLTRHRD